MTTHMPSVETLVSANEHFDRVSSVETEIEALCQFHVSLSQPASNSISLMFSSQQTHQHLQVPEGPSPD